MTSLIQELLGKRVTIYSISGGGGAADTGVLEACDSQWVRLGKSGEMLYFPIHNIRLIKPSP